MSRYGQSLGISDAGCGQKRKGQGWVGLCLFVLISFICNSVHTDLYMGEPYCNWHGMDESERREKIKKADIGCWMRVVHLDSDE